MADRPANSAARKPSRVSPSGVLTDIPVITIRRSLDTVELHRRHRGDAAGAAHLSSHHRGGAVVFENSSAQCHFLSWENGSRKDRVVNLDRANRSGALVTTRAKTPGEPDAELPRHFELKHSGIDRIAGKVP